MSSTPREGLEPTSAHACASMPMHAEAPSCKLPAEWGDCLEKGRAKHCHLTLRILSHKLLQDPPSINAASPSCIGHALYLHTAQAQGSKPT